jgi:hypothetical protein
MKIAKLTTLVKAKVLQCANGELDLQVYTWDVAKGKAEGCIKNETTLDPDIKEMSMKAVDESSATAASDPHRSRAPGFASFRPRLDMASSPGERESERRQASALR